MIRAIDRFLENVKRIRRSRVLSPLEKDLEKKIGRAFRIQGREFLREFARYRDRFSEAVNDDELARVFSATFAETDEDLSGPIEGVAAAAIAASYRHRSAEMGIVIAFDLENPPAIEYLKQRAARRVTDINETTRGEIARLVVKGNEEGWSYDRTAREISKRFREFAVGKPQQHIQSRAHLVAITEVAEAYEDGNRRVADDLQQAGLEMEKHWRDSGDERVSDGCAMNAADGWIHCDQAHSSGHMHPPRFPGCRCWEEYRRRSTNAIS